MELEELEFEPLCLEAVYVHLRTAPRGGLPAYQLLLIALVALEVVETVPMNTTRIHRWNDVSYYSNIVFTLVSVLAQHNTLYGNCSKKPCWPGTGSQCKHNAKINSKLSNFTSFAAVSCTKCTHLYLFPITLYTLVQDAQLRSEQASLDSC